MVTWESQPESSAGINCISNENGLLTTSCSNREFETNIEINQTTTGNPKDIDTAAKQVVFRPKLSLDREVWSIKAGKVSSNDHARNRKCLMNYQFCPSMMKPLLLILILVIVALSILAIAQQSVINVNTTTSPSPSSASATAVATASDEKVEKKQLFQGFLPPPPNNDPTIVYGRIIQPGSKKPCYNLPCHTDEDTQSSDGQERTFLRVRPSKRMPSFPGNDDGIVYATIDTGVRRTSTPEPEILTSPIPTVTEATTTTTLLDSIIGLLSNSPDNKEEQKKDTSHSIVIAPNPVQPDPNYYDNEIAITIDKIKGIEFPLSIMSQLRDSRRKSSSNSKNNNNDNRSDKCSVNKYDRLIEQEMAAGNLSRPIVDSDGRYDNPFPTWRRQSVMDIIKFMMLEPNGPRGPRDQAELDTNVPLLKPNFRVNNQQDSGDFRATWIGHSTLLIQVDGFNILTDPVFSDRASPVQYVGPKRIREPACDIKSLPKIDIVLISHNHYDHLDSNSVRELNDRFGDQCRWIVPLGLGEYLDSMSVTNYAELNWWQKDCFSVSNYNSIIKKEFQNRPKVVTQRTSSLVLTKEQRERAMKKSKSELDIYLTPSQHWTRRGIADINKTLWGSFTLVSGSGATFFFTGDTAYCRAFKEIGRIFGPFTGAAIPIGAYSPRWFLKTVHVNPQEAIQIHRDIRSNRSIAIHHATFILSKEHYLEPATLLRLESDNLNLQQPFTTIRHGESTEFCKAC